MYIMAVRPIIRLNLFEVIRYLYSYYIDVVNILTEERIVSKEII